MVRLALPGNRQICTQHEIENTPCILTASRCINLSRQCQVSGQCQVRIDSEVFMSTGTEFMSQCTASNLAEPVPRTTSRPELGKFLVSTDNGSEGARFLDFAGLLAEENGARLISVFTKPAPPFTRAESFALGMGIRALIEKQDSQLESIEARHRAGFEDIVRRYGISRSEWRSLSHWSSEVAVNAYYADLVVMSRPERTGQMSDSPGLAESLVLSSGRPIILFPPRGTASLVRSILICWYGTREAIRAVADAVPLLGRADAVEDLIADHQRQRARHGQEPGAEIARRLAALGGRVWGQS